MARVRVFPIILNFQSAGDTMRCLGAVLGSSYRWIFPIVVDNGSDPGCVESLRSWLDPTIDALYLPSTAGTPPEITQASGGRSSATPTLCGS